MGTEDVKVTAMNMFKCKERDRERTEKNIGHCGPTQGQRKTLTRVVKWKFVWAHNGQCFSLSLCRPISISRANAHMVHMG